MWFISLNLPQKFDSSVDKEPILNKSLGTYSYISKMYFNSAVFEINNTGSNKMVN